MVISVFGSSRPRRGDPYYRQAQALGAELASRGFVVCTGGYSGVMEAASRGAKQAGGSTLGVTAAFFPSRANRWVDHEIRVRNWRDRLFELVNRGHGYVVCRGGTGTLVELAVVWELLNKGVIDQRPLVAVGNFWAPLVESVERAEGGQRRKRARSVQFADSPQDAVDYLVAHFKGRSPARRRNLAPWTNRI